MIIIGAAVMAQMLAIGANHTLGQLASMPRHPRALLRYFLPVLVLFPAVVILLVYLFDLSPAIVTGLAILAAAPGAPMTTKRSEIAAADLDFVSPLQLTLALSAVVFTPLMLALFYALFDLTIERVSPVAIARQVAMVTFLPVFIGLALQKFAPGIAAKARKPINVIANVLFLVMAGAVILAIAITPELQQALVIGWPGTAVIAIMSVAAIALGHAFGGPGNRRRAGLATATLARNIGLAIFIAGMSEPGEVAVPTILVFAAIGITFGVIYGIWIKRQPD